MTVANFLEAALSITPVRGSRSVSLRGDVQRKERVLPEEQVLTRRKQVSGVYAVSLHHITFESPFVLS